MESGILEFGIQNKAHGIRNPSNDLESGAQLFEGRLALNPGLNLTRVSFSCVQKHFLG